MNKKTEIMGIKAPKKTCEDVNCPFHGTLKVRGKTFAGTVVSDKMQKSVIVQWTGWRFVPKFERYKKTRTKISVHSPDCIDAKKGDVVKIGECRPVSKTKTFVVLGIVGEESLKEKIKEEAVADSKKEYEKVAKAPAKAVSSDAPKSEE